MTSSTVRKRAPPSIAVTDNVWWPSKRPGSRVRPSQVTLRPGSSSRILGSEGHGPMTGRDDGHPQPPAHGQLTAGAHDEGVPAHVGGQVADHLPDPLGRGRDVDGGIEGAHQLAALSAGVQGVALQRPEVSRAQR